MSGLGEYGCLLPLDRVGSDHANKARNNVVGLVFANVLACMCVIHGNAKIRGGDLDRLEIIFELLGRIYQVRAMEGRSDGQEAVDKAHFALGEGYPGLV